jgi:hypothetical protein
VSELKNWRMVMPNDQERGHEKKRVLFYIVLLYMRRHPSRTK